MIYQKFSRRQQLTLKWWKLPSFQTKDGLICDGSIRSGKTISMAIGFILWSMNTFDGQAFAICGRSIGALRRNVIVNLPVWLEGIFNVVERRGENKLIISLGGRSNTYYLFGGRDESSYTLIQGVTLAGVLFDEVALQPRSFVEQALARCSVAGSKFWFNCNPENPLHWFYQEWICRAKKHNVIYLHFTMDDNLSLDAAVRARYESMYSGVFYDRYIRGLWRTADGVIYDCFSSTENVYRELERPIGLYSTAERFIACDYGTANPTRFLDVWDDGNALWVDGEYDWDSRREQRQKTDQEYVEDLLAFMGERQCAVIVDPSAASFIAALRGRGVYVLPADNTVTDGIRKTASLIAQRRLKVRADCRALLREMGVYCWDKKAAQRGEEQPLKENDHSLDALRYMVNYLPEWRIG